MNASRTIGRKLATGWAVGAACTVICLAPAAVTRQRPAPPSESAPPSSIASTNQPSENTPFSRSVADVVRLLDSGVSDEVVKTYIENSARFYSLPADQIIALKERGVPADIIVAMISQTKEMRSRMAQAARAQGQAVGAAAPNQPAEMPAPYESMTLMQPGTYAPEPAYSSAPYSYSYWYSGYPSYSAWWWGPNWGYYPNRLFYRSSPFFRQGDRFHTAIHRPTQWPDAYPNRIVAGPNWGADRGLAPRQARWADAYPNRVVTAPNWGADRGFTPQRANVPLRGGAMRMQRPSGFRPSKGGSHPGRG